MKKAMTKALLCSVAVAGATCAAVAPASAQTKIVLNDIGGVTGSPAELGFKIAASYWESVLTNNVTIEFDVGFSALGAGILGGTSTTLNTYVPISDYYDALSANATSALDMQAVASLQPLSATGSVKAIVPQYQNVASKSGVRATGGRAAPDGKAITNTMALASSNYQALYGDTAGTDANIQFSSTFAFDFDPTDGITAGTYDFIGVAIHEMGHALGFLSAADDFDYSVGGGFPTDNYWWAYALDMFRYTGSDTLNWRFNVPAYFSIDGGDTAFLGDSYFSTGSNYGDGWQASHWKAPGGCANLIGIMNPYICDGVVDEMTAADLGLLDAIGWGVNLDVLANTGYVFSTADVYKAYFAGGAVPEPSSWLMMILGFGAIGGAIRYRSRGAKVSFA
ncbi:NF038122 family metalloprotease [Sphingomonas sp. RS6]